MKFLIVASTKDLASMNMAKHFDNVFIVEKELLDLTQDDLEKADFYIFLSKHRSLANKPSLTVHVPGNLTENCERGNPKEICPCSPELNTILLNKIKEKSLGLSYEVCFEVVHHTPTDLKGKAVFVEIGSSEKEWRDEKAGEVMAKAVKEAIEIIKNKNYEEKERVIGFGGGHYAPKFTKLALEGKYYFGYLVPKYAQVDEDVLNQMVEKSEVDKILIDWKGCRGEDKRRYINFFESLGIPWEKI
ncbi:Protein of unknown function DUF516 [Methanocaldococcus infernus ME]|uniref:D-aminoacyl-tRNA deacylase n=1 Tax=Methanocaldococcus infernus (strain DSM 11812 / JCM 15783 / ME) TaxID=573063 RepID=D5VT01_METIM|nr:D-aminoacyl-tRNA deacylase [Methanocaldococcus infernus]ADG13704.1 Protein of unknown function DUF516 [Methanocaldococcus infernus ME]